MKSTFIHSGFVILGQARNDDVGRVLNTPAMEPLMAEKVEFA